MTGETVEPSLLKPLDESFSKLKELFNSDLKKYSGSGKYFPSS